MVGSLQYVVKDVMSSALEELFPGDLIFCYQDLEELLNPRLLISYICKIWKQRGQAFCEHVFTSWKSAILSLPREVHSSATLHRCLDLLEGLDEAEELMRAEYPETFSKGFYEKRWLVDNLEAFLHKTFASMTIELVRQKVDVETVEQTFHYIDHGEKAKSDLWKLVQGHPRCCSVGLRFGLGADLMMALIEKGLPRWCWAGHSDFYEDNLLQHIMAPVAAVPGDWDPQEGGAKARLCTFLAERFSLKELCYQNRDFKNALWYVLQYCENSPFQADPLWVRVRDVIRERMQRQVREFQGSLLALVDLARSVRSSSGCNLTLLATFDSFPLSSIIPFIIIHFCSFPEKNAEKALERLPHEVVSIRWIISQLLKSRCGSELPSFATSGWGRGMMVPKRKLLPCTMLHYSPWLSISSIWVGLKVGYAEKYDKVIPHFNDLGPLFSDKTGLKHGLQGKVSKHWRHWAFQFNPATTL